MHFATSGIDTPLKVLSMFGVITGILLLSGLAYATVYNSPFTFLELLNAIDGVFVFLGGLVALTASMSIDRRSGLVFLVVTGSIFAMFGLLSLLSPPPIPTTPVGLGRKALNPTV